MTKDELIESYVSDAMLEKPIALSVGGEDYKIYPPSFGKMQILSKLFLLLEIDEKALSDEPHIESMRVCREKTDIVCRLIAVATLKTKDELLDDKLVADRSEHIKWNGKPEDFSKVMMAILTQIDYSNFISSITLTKMLRLNKPKQEGINMVE